MSPASTSALKRSLSSTCWLRACPPVSRCENVPLELTIAYTASPTCQQRRTTVSWSQGSPPSRLLTKTFSPPRMDRHARN